MININHQLYYSYFVSIIWWKIHNNWISDYIGIILSKMHCSFSYHFQLFSWSIQFNACTITRNTSLTNSFLKKSIWFSLSIICDFCVMAFNKLTSRNMIFNFTIIFNSWGTILLVCVNILATNQRISLRWLRNLQLEIM